MAVLTHVAGGVACPAEFKEPAGAALSATDIEIGDGIGFSNFSFAGFMMTAIAEGNHSGLGAILECEPYAF
jgi:hypothetical protein